MTPATKATGGAYSGAKTIALNAAVSGATKPGMTMPTPGTGVAAM